MAKLSEESKKKIAESVKRSWVLRRTRLAAKAVASRPTGTKHATKGRRRLSADAKRRIAEAVKLSWATRRAGRTARATRNIGPAGTGGIIAAVERASKALRALTLDDLRPLAGRRDAAVRLEELATLASDLRRMITT